MKPVVLRLTFLIFWLFVGRFGYAQIEIPASFVGGATGYHNYLNENLKYPIKAYKSGKDYKVKAVVLILADGKAMIETFLSDSSGLGFEEEVTRFIDAMPKWIPAKHSGVNAESQIILSFNFHLEVTSGNEEVETPSEVADTMQKLELTEVYEQTDIPPFYDGGLDSLKAKVKRIILTTFDEVQITGSCKMKFVVTKTGSIKKLVFTENSTNLSEAQLNFAFFSAGKWEAGLINAQKISALMEITLTFN